MKMTEELERLLNIHLRVEDSPKRKWYIGDSPISGRGVFAKANLKPGDIIFEDIPLIAGPRLKEAKIVCSGCLRGDLQVSGCERGCGLPVCSKYCTYSPAHVNECALLSSWLERSNTNQSSEPFWYKQCSDALMAVRGLFLNGNAKRLVSLLQTHTDPQHGHEVYRLKAMLGEGIISEDEEAWMLRICQVMDAISYEIEHSSQHQDVNDDADVNKWSLRGLYPLSGLLNHSCSPNTRHYTLLGHPGYTMRMVATTPILKNEELTTHYCPLLWATLPRRHFLSITKHFLCKCSRCSDPTEFGTNFSAVKCERCIEGMALPLRPLEMGSPWICDNCSARVDPKFVVLVLARGLCPGSGTSTSKQMSLQMELGRVWKRGRSERTLRELSLKDLHEHEASVRRILKLMENLRLGQCRKRGLLLFELYKSLQERKRRNEESDEEEDIDSFLREAVAILKDDTSAPRQILQFINSRK